MTDKDIAIIKSQLEIAATALEAAFLLLESEEKQESKDCQHPEDSRQDCSTSGTQRYLCKICGELVEEQMREGEENVDSP